MDGYWTMNSNPCTRVCTRVYVHMYVCICTYVYTRVYMCIRVYTRVRTCVCVCCTLNRTIRRLSDKRDTAEGPFLHIASPTRPHPLTVTLNSVHWGGGVGVRVGGLQSDHLCEQYFSPADQPGDASPYQI